MYIKCRTTQEHNQMKTADGFPFLYIMHMYIHTHMYKTVQIQHVHNINIEWIHAGSGRVKYSTEQYGRRASISFSRRIKSMSVHCSADAGNSNST